MAPEKTATGPSDTVQQRMTHRIHNTEKMMPDTPPKRSWFWRGLGILITIASGVALGFLFCYSSLAWSGRLILPPARHEITAPAASSPEWQLAARELATEEVARAEARLRDHFTFLIGLVGITVTIILAGFTFVLSRREERSERELTETKDKCQKMCEEIVDLCKKARIEYESMSKLMDQVSKKTGAEDNASQQSTSNVAIHHTDVPASREFQEEALHQDGAVSSLEGKTGDTPISELQNLEQVSLKALQENADKGDAEAQFRLGKAYYFGKGVEQNYEEAEKWYRKAAETGDIKAQFNLGCMYDFAEGVEQNYEEAEKWYRKAAEAGAANAQFNLGCMYDFGRGVKQNYEEAVKWYRKAAEGGDVKVLLNLGNMYYFGRGVEQNYVEAVKWYRMAAEAGDVKAQFNLGCMYDFAEGVEQNYEEAEKWYRKAAEAGAANAQFNLGCMYDFGRGVKQNYEEAVKWYRKAAEGGDVKVLLNLGNMYYFGRGVEQNYEEAEKWYRKAAEAGDVKAQFNLGGMYELGRKGVPQDYAEAEKWYRKAAEAGTDLAQFRLGELYRHGQGVPCDPIQSAQYFQKAADAGYAPAALQLSRCYLEGEGVPPNMMLAYAYLSFYRTVKIGDDDVKALLKRMEAELTTAQRKQAQAKVDELYEKALKLREAD